MLQEAPYMLMSSGPRRKSFILGGPLALGEETMMQNKVTQANSLQVSAGTYILEGSNLYQ